MKHFLSVYLPTWSIDLYLLRKNTHGKLHKDRLILTERVRGRETILRASSALTQQGIEPGISVVVAQGICPELTQDIFTPQEDLIALLKLARWCQKRISPIVSLEREMIEAHQKKRLGLLDPIYTGIIIDITGTEKLHRGFRNLARSLYARLKQKGIRCSLAVAPTTGASWALSRFSQKPFISIRKKEEIRNILSPLPLQALRLSTEDLEALQTLGIHTVEELFALPRKELLERFGISPLTRVDQALGYIEEPLYTLRHKTPLICERIFDAGIERLSAVERISLDMLEELLGQLEKKKQVASLYRLALSGLDCQAKPYEVRKEFSLLEGSRNEKQLRNIFSRIFENERLLGPIYQFRLTAHLCQHFSGEQIHSMQDLSREAPSHELEGVMNNITSFLGKENVHTLSFRESHIPERSFSFQPKSKRTPRSTSPIFQKRSYPSYILSHPERIDAIALLPDKPPVKITWRKKSYRVVHAFGPERISSEWWCSSLEQAQEEREYFTLQEEGGRWLWTFRCRKSQEWYLHGVWA